MIRIDAHHHVWRLERGDYGWLKPEMAIYRDYSLDHLRPLLGEIDATVLVQAAPTEAETRFLLDVARASGGLVRGVVGWTDLAAPDARARIASVARDPLLKGLRPMLQDLAEPDWILRPELQPALAEIAARGLVFDALIRPPQLPAIRELARRHPTLCIVIDHGAKPAIAVDAFHGWAEQTARVADETGACCKLSGLVTEARPDWRIEDLRPYAQHMLAVFGPRRLLWGSDWPVVELAGGYEKWLNTARHLLSGLSSADRDAVLGDTARSVYRL